MKKQLLVVFLISALLFTCSQKEEPYTFEKDTQAYELAQKLSEKIDRLDPEKNDVLIKSDRFDVTVGETLEGIFRNFGKNAAQLAQMQTAQVKNIIMSNANGIAEKKLLEYAAKDNGFTADPGEVDSVMELQYKAVGGKEKFIERISQNNIDLETVRESVESGIMINALLDKEVPAEDIMVTDAEIKAEYEPEKSRQAQHILIDTQEDSTEAQKQADRKKIESILKKAKAGENFGELAKEYSDCPSSKKGGDLGKFSKGQMVPEFDNVVFNMEVGEISDVVETQFGYHIIKLNDIIKNDYEDVKDQLKQRVVDRKRQSAVQQYIKDLKTNSNLEEISL